VFKDDTMARLDPPWTANAFHPTRIVPDIDALEPWQMIAIAAVTVVTAFICESREYAKRKRLVPGFRGGVVTGLIVALLSTCVMGWMSYRVLSAGAVRCFGKYCRGVLVEDRYIFMHANPVIFWINYITMSFFTVAALMFLFGCTRSAMRWRELD
jgi:hypothetical protein